MTRVSLVTALAISAIACARGGGDDVATFRVEAVKFVRRIGAEGTLKAVTATPVSAPRQARSPLKIAWIAEDGAVVERGDVIVEFDPTDFENLLLAGRDDRATAANKLSKATAESTATAKNLRRDARLADTELEAAQRFTFDDEEIFSRYARIEAELDQDLAAHKKRHANDVLQVRQRLARIERDLLAIEDRKAGLKIKEAEDGMLALQVTAPHDGLFILQRNWRGETPRVGESLWRGQPIGEIPKMQAMRAEVFVLEADAAGLAPGQKVTLFLESNPRMPFEGKIASVDKVARPRIARQPVQYFGVKVDLERTDPRVMKPGTRVRAILELDNQANALAIPRQAVFDRAGKKVVYRKHAERFEPVQVTLGSATAGRVVVTTGVSRGDEVALEDPELSEERGKRKAEQ